MLLPDLVVTHHHSSPKAHDLPATHEDHLEHSQAKGPGDHHEATRCFRAETRQILKKGLLFNENRGHFWVPGVHT